ncbi:MAG: hypothetical protein ACOVNL_09730 [Prochlorococcaceae cyanobacterium]|jgi:hypothetical protein
MAATRLSEAQKSELVVRFRGGESSQALADHYGCSANTVSRVVKLALDPEEYERLKGRRSRRSESAPLQDSAGPADPAAAEVAAQLEIPPAPAVDDDEPEQPEPAPHPRSRRELESEEEETASHLAIDDAEDFGDDADDGEDSDDAEDSLEDEPSDLFVVVPLAGTVVDGDRAPLEPQPLEQAELPGSVFMLVDKTVELEVRPLREFSDLPPLPKEEEERQALMVFANSRNAKRNCGRTQRVIKVPDTDVFLRTAPYLVRKGITRLVVDGALYSLPGC